MNQICSCRNQYESGTTKKGCNKSFKAGRAKLRPGMRLYIVYTEYFTYSGLYIMYNRRCRTALHDVLNLMGWNWSWKGTNYSAEQGLYLWKLYFKLIDFCSSYTIAELKISPDKIITSCFISQLVWKTQSLCCSKHFQLKTCELNKYDSYVLNSFSEFLFPETKNNIVSK